MAGVLLKAVSAGRPRQVRFLLASGTPLNVSDDTGQTAVIRAVLLEARPRRETILRMLLKAGARVSKTDSTGRTAVAWACILGFPREVRWFLQYADVDLDLNQPDVDGRTCLFHAVDSGNVTTVCLVVEALLKYGLSVEVRDNDGITPLMHAIRINKHTCAAALIQRGGASAGKNLKSAKEVELASKMWTKRQSGPEGLHTSNTKPSNVKCKDTDFSLNFPSLYQQNNRKASLRRNTFPRIFVNFTTTKQNTSEEQTESDPSGSTTSVPHGLEDIPEQADGHQFVKQEVLFARNFHNSTSTLTSNVLSASRRDSLQSTSTISDIASGNQLYHSTTSVNTTDLDWSRPKQLRTPLSAAINSGGQVVYPPPKVLLRRLYTMYEQQYSSGYRPVAVRPPSPERDLAVSPTAHETMPTEQPTAHRNAEVKSSSKWMQCKRKMLLTRKNNPQK